MTIPFFVLDSFTDTPFQGNPAGVFFDDDGILTANDMRRYAGEVHLESAFVLPPEGSDVDFRIRYFTGVTEVPLCGHATVAAMTALWRGGRVEPGTVVNFGTSIGVIRASMTDEGQVTLYQTVLEIGPVCNKDQTTDVAAALGCDAKDILGTRLPVQRISTGTAWLLVPCRSSAVVDAAPRDYKAISRISTETHTFGIYLFHVGTERSSHDAIAMAIWSRCFAPIAGLNEDPVTGSASGALGAYLLKNRAKHLALGQTLSLSIKQGFAGGRGGSVRVSARRDSSGGIDAVAVTGTAVSIAEGAFTAR